MKQAGLRGPACFFLIITVLGSASPSVQRVLPCSQRAVWNPVAGWISGVLRTSELIEVFRGYTLVSTVEPETEEWVGVSYFHRTIGTLWTYDRRTWPVAWAQAETIVFVPEINVGSNLPTTEAAYNRDRIVHLVSLAHN